MDFETQFGEGFAGDGTNAAHINTVLGAKGGPVETAWVTALAQPTPGHVPFVAVLRPGLPLKPFTLFVNKATIAGDAHAALTWGAAQAGVAKGVTDALVTDVIERARVDHLLLVVAVWVSPQAADPELVFGNNAQATLDALRVGSRQQPTVAELLAERATPFNPFFRAPRS
jgi:5,6,7,8-tetrahydromethanopterin hydro-lyase